jgi:hypothetical protein
VRDARGGRVRRAITIEAPPTRMGRLVAAADLYLWAGRQSTGRPLTAPMGATPTPPRRRRARPGTAGSVDFSPSATGWGPATATTPSGAAHLRAPPWVAWPMRSVVASAQRHPAGGGPQGKRRGFMERQCLCGHPIHRPTDALGCIACGRACCPACAVPLESVAYCAGCASGLLEVPRSHVAGHRRLGRDDEITLL